MSKYRCPACGFQIFNRRVAKCESCGVAVPRDLLLSAQEASKLDARYERGTKERDARLRRQRQSAGTDASMYGGEASCVPCAPCAPCAEVDNSGDGGGGGCD
jgi:hypothetical protein